MPKKFFQYFANTLSQRFLDIPDAQDLALLARLQSGTVVIDILNGSCIHNNVAITPLKTCLNYQEWLWRELDRNHVLRTDVYHATLTVRFAIKYSEADEIPAPGVVTFAFDCQSEIRTSEQSYLANHHVEKSWTLEPYRAKVEEGLVATRPVSENELAA